MQLVKFCLVASSLALAGCQSIPPPQGYGCVALPKKNRMVCFDLAKDFDPKTGNPLPNAMAKYFDLSSLNQIDKWVIFDPDSFASLKGFALKNKDRCERMAGVK